MLSITIVGVITVLSLLWYYLRHTFSYWQRKGIPFIEPEIPWGNFRKFTEMHQSELIQQFYHQMKGKAQFFGIYAFQNPMIVPTDLEFIKNIMIKDFGHFQDRGIFFNEKHDPLSATLFSIEGQKWRQLRAKITPTFTSGKMKFMFPTVLTVADRFVDTIDKMIELDGFADVEIKELLARFTTDVIGECAFGIECNTLANPDTEFRTMGRKVFAADKWLLAKFFLYTMFPETARFFGGRTTAMDVESFFMGIVKDTVRYRENNETNRKDFMNLLIGLKNAPAGQNITINELAAQSFVFFLAGFETSSTVMTFALYELMLQPDIQQKGRDEVKRILEKYDGKLTYEAVLEMTYIDQILDESLRKYPPVANLQRVVTKDYKVPGSDFVLEKGVAMFIPVYAIQRDPEYFPDPDRFDPDRFTADEKLKRHSSTYLPFGDGPRNCIGIRFGMMQARIGLAMLLHNYEFTKCDQTPIPLSISKTEFILSVEGGVYLKIRKIST